MNTNDSGFLDYLANGGVLAWLAILVALALFVGGGLLFIVARSRKIFIPFLIAAFLPVAIGSAGMVVGNMLVDRVLETQGSARPGEEESGRRQARIPLEIGAVASLPLVLMGLAGLLVTRDRTASTP